VGSKLFVLACTAGLAVAVAAGASAQPHLPASGYQRLHVDKAVVGSTPVRVWANAAINPDCSAQTPDATLTILEQPAHGAAVVKDEPYYVAFPPANPRSACNDRKVPGHQAFYTAAAGYTGHDRMVLQGSSPDGAVRRIAVDITVR